MLILLMTVLCRMQKQLSQRASGVSQIRMHALISFTQMKGLSRLVSFASFANFANVASFANSVRLVLPVLPVLSVLLLSLASFAGFASFASFAQRYELKKEMAPGKT